MVYAVTSAAKNKCGFRLKISKSIKISYFYGTICTDLGKFAAQTSVNFSALIENGPLHTPKRHKTLPDLLHIDPLCH
jgi:hypothetical protein